MASRATSTSSARRYRAFDEAKKLVYLDIDIDEGKQFYVSRIEFTGNTITRDNVIRRELLVEEGQVYNQQLVDLALFFVQFVYCCIDKLLVIHLAFFHQQFAANHAVARDAVAAELNARHIELLAFAAVNVQVDQVLGIVEPRYRRANELDIALPAIGLLQRFQAFAEDHGVEVVAILDREHRAQRLGVAEVLVVAERDAAQAIALAFLNRE